MIKFFRKIRQKLLAEGRTGKYLTYAIGEIMLVVLGILIALQINNWNERQKSRSSELVYYQRVLEDFELEKVLIDSLNGQANKRIEVSKQILRDLDEGIKDKNYILNKFLTAIRGDIYVTMNVTFRDLVSSGNLHLLTDLKLKNSLLKFYGDVENTNFQLSQNRNEKVNEVFKLINHELGFGSQEFNYVKDILGPEIMKTLPDVDWIDDKKSEIYQKFQTVLIFNISMADRERQHYKTIQSLMEEPYELLVMKCKDENPKMIIK